MNSRPRNKNRRIQLKPRVRQKISQRRVAAVVSLFVLFGAGGLFLFLNSRSENAYAAVSYTWTGTAGTDWNNSSNWTPSGVPGLVDNVTIATATHNIVLTSEITVNNITVNTSANINLNGYNLISNGTSAFNSGVISNSGGSCNLTAQGSSTTFGSGAAGPTISSGVIVTSANITIANTTFNGICSFTKTGSTNNSGAGNNTYNGAVTFTNSGTGYLLMANSTRDIFNTDVTFTSASSGIIYAAYNGINTQFNQNIVVNSTSTGGVRIGANGGTATLATGKIVSVGSSGVSSGLVMLGGLTTATNQSLTFTGSGVLQLGPNSTFNADVVATCGGICLSGATFNGIANFSKTGASNDQGAGNNTFNGVTSISNSGSGYLMMSNSTRDIFNTDVTFTSTAAGIIYPAYNGTNTQFNQNIIINSTLTGGIRIGANSGTATLATGKVVSVGSSGVSGGLIMLGGLTTATNQSFTFTGSGVLQLGPNSTFNADVVATCGGICLSGATFNGIANFSKTGASNDQGAGNNTFNGVTSISNSGSGYLMMSNSTRDIFNTDITFTSTGTGIIYVAYNGVNTQFNQNIIVNSTSTGGVRIGANSGTATLATGKVVSVGSSGVSGGLIMLGGLTTATNQSLTFTGSGVLQLGPNSTFNADVVATCGGICLSGATFNGIANFSKTGANNDQGAGNNTFNGVTSISNSGSGYLLMSNSTRDIFNTDVTLTSTGTGIIYVAYNGVNTQFNQNIIVNSTSTGGVRIGASGGTSTLATGKTVSAGSAGVSNGVIILSGITTGTNQSFSFTGNAVLQLGPGSTFGGDVTATCGGICLNGATYNSSASFTKTGATNDAGTGNNTFNGTTTITNSGSGYFLTANSTRDIFNSEVSFKSTGAGITYVSYNGTNTQFNQNINVSSTGTGSIRFGQSNGTSILADGKMINIGSSGFASGDLYLRKFTQSGSTAQSLSISSGTSALYLQIGTTFSAATTFSFPQLYLNGATFNETTALEKKGATNNSSSGGNVFNSTTTITNSGSGNFLLANSSADDFNGNATFIQTGSGLLQPAYNTNCTFEKNISTAGTSTAITFGTGASGRVTIDGTLPQSISGASALIPVFTRLTMAQSGSEADLTLNVPVTVTTNLTLTSGVITTGTNELKVTSTVVSSITGFSSDSYINGNLRRSVAASGAYDFPLGTSANYELASITLSSATGFTNILGTFTQTVPITLSLPLVSVLLSGTPITDMLNYGYWTMTPNSAMIGGTYNIILNEKGATNANTNPQSFCILKRTNILSSWASIGSHTNSTQSITSGVVTAMRSGLTGFSDFGEGESSGGSLPIKLIYFTAKLTDNIVNLDWATAAEINNNFFTVERSSDGENFEPILTKPGAGNSTVNLYYNATDDSPLSGYSYYRLKQTDYDGHYTYSDVETVKNGEGGGGSDKLEIKSIAPNPFTESFKLVFMIKSAVQADFSLMNSSGQMVAQEKIQTEEGINTYEFIDKYNLKKGIYFVNLFYNDQKLIQKVMKE